MRARARVVTHRSRQAIFVSPSVRGLFGVPFVGDGALSVVISARPWNSREYLRRRRRRRRCCRRRRRRHVASRTRGGVVSHRRYSGGGREKGDRLIVIGETKSGVGYVVKERRRDGRPRKSEDGPPSWVHKQGEGSAWFWE